MSSSTIEGNIEELFDVQAANFSCLERARSDPEEMRNPTPAKLRVRRAYAETTWDQSRRVHAQIIHLATDIERRHSYFKELLYENAEGLYIDLISDYEEAMPAVTPSTSTLSQSAAALNPPPQGRTTAHLPRIKLPKFSGNFNNWDSFSDLFKSIIVDDPGIDKVRKFHYLKSCLEGEPRSMIDHLTSTNENFEIAWDTLVSYFSNKRCIIDSHLTDLFALSVVRSESVTDLRELYHTGVSILGALTSLGEPVDSWNSILVHFFVSRLDPDSRKTWATILGSRITYPSFDEFKTFLKNRIHGLQSAASSVTRHPSSSARINQVSKSSMKNKTQVQSYAVNAAKNRCPSCIGEHFLYSCKRFRNLDVVKRLELVKRFQLCNNCLGSHALNNCTSKYTCSACHQRHHTLLHRDRVSGAGNAFASGNNRATPSLADVDQGEGQPEVVLTHFSANQPILSANILLATATVRVHSTCGRVIRVRALLDQGSTWTFVSESLANALNSRVCRVTTSVSRIGGSSAGSVTRAADLRISAAHSDTPSYHTHALILKKLTSYVPSVNASISCWPHLKGLPLADIDPNGTESIQLIIGADLYGSILLEGVAKGDKGQLTAQNTTFGWVLSGWTVSPSTLIPSSVTSHLCNSDTSLNDALSRFWEIEEVPSKRSLSSEDSQCEQHFCKTYSRTSGGRYMVRLPFRSPPPLPIGNSRRAALNSFRSLEARLARNSGIAVPYIEFMRDYADRSHMSLIPTTEPDAPAVYLPHHGVIKSTSSTTKLRVVFNASFKTSNATSLNDHLLTGPVLQSDLIHVVLRWRSFQFVYCADIAQMYRQILIDPRDRDYQRIIWRESSDEPVSEFRLNTVTFGVSSAPFLALRVLRQLVQDHGCNYPLAADVLLTDSYVDDCLFGADTPTQARQIRNQLIKLLDHGGFRLRKWASNATDLIVDIDPSDHGLALEKPLLEEDIRILGVSWNPTRDAYQFAISLMPPKLLTKRTLLSLIARLYDPLGWVSPVMISAKILIQQLWSLKLDWDSPLPASITSLWTEFYTSLPALSSFSIPRWTGQTADISACELHGFADTSTTAYAAVVYLRTRTPNSSFSSTLLLSRMKVAPLRQLSIPRLELSAAVLLSRTLDTIRSVASYASLPIHCWSDSTIVLHWIQQPSTRWKTFVANRVSEIQTTLPTASWRHVPGTENPADLASRGIPAPELVDNLLWKHGPCWLVQDQPNWPYTFPIVSADAPLEDRATVYANVSFVNDTLSSLLDRVASWTRFVRVIAYLRRWKTRITDGEIPGELTASDLQGANVIIFKWLQAYLFPEELRLLQLGRNVGVKSTMVSLHPFIDADGLIRLGGRLRHSNLPPSRKHPIILKAHPAMRLLVEWIHSRCLHGGVRLMLRTLRQTIWLIQATKIIRSVIFKCVSCARIKAILGSQLLGDLPSTRVTYPERPFTHCGVDYAGPFKVRMSSGRGHKSQMAYIAVFVCFAVKAVHLELVSDYSSLTFIAAFKCFIARRGIPKIMYSDQGTTFTGADTELSKAFKLARKDPKFRALLAHDGVSWQFIPPASPHFGGLWEDGVKSVKFHLRRILKDHYPTFEEMTTLLCEIEAMLNSRPLGPLTCDSDDVESLTPGHF